MDSIRRKRIERLMGRLTPMAAFPRGRAVALRGAHAGWPPCLTGQSECNTGWMRLGGMWVVNVDELTVVQKALAVMLAQEPDLDVEGEVAGSKRAADHRRSTQMNLLNP